MMYINSIYEHLIINYLRLIRKKSPVNLEEAG